MKPSHSDIDPLAKFSGPAATIAVSLPSDLIELLRAAVGKRELSQFVGRAIASELIDRSRAAFVAEAEALHGPVDPELKALLVEAFRR